MLYLSKWWLVSGERWTSNQRRITSPLNEYIDDLIKKIKSLNISTWTTKTNRRRWCCVVGVVFTREVGRHCNEQVCEGVKCKVCEGVKCKVCQGVKCKVCQGVKCKVCQGVNCKVCQGVKCKVCQG